MEGNLNSEDVIEQTNAIMDWAFKLGYSDAKNVRIAAAALGKKGLIDKPEARCAANMYLDLKGLHNLGDKYIPIENAAAAAE